MKKKMKCNKNKQNQINFEKPTVHIHDAAPILARETSEGKSPPTRRRRHKANGKNNPQTADEDERPVRKEKQKLATSTPGVSSAENSVHPELQKLNVQLETTVT